MDNSNFVNKILLFLSLAVILAGCTTPGKQRVKVQEYNSPIDFSAGEQSGLLKTQPSGGHPVFFASVQRMSNRDNEAASALLYASEQASKFTAVKAVSKFYTEKMNSSIKYMRDLDVFWDRDLALEMIDRLEVKSIIRDTYGTYLTAELPDTEMKKIPWNSTSKDGVPDWTSRIPDIPGFIVSVGIALQDGYTADSFAAADNQALEDLARQISVEIVTGRKLIENARGTASVQTNFEISEVVIPEFYILERWRTPDARYYYSLAVAPAGIVEKYRND